MKTTRYTDLESPSFGFASHDDLSRFLKDYYLEKLRKEPLKPTVTIINNTVINPNFTTLTANKKL